MEQLGGVLDLGLQAAQGVLAAAGPSPPPAPAARSHYVVADLVAKRGVGPHTASTRVVVAGDNPHRLHSEKSFAALLGSSPIPASRGGDRQGNAALWRIALVRLSTDQPLDAWYVDTAQAHDPDADIERGLAHGGVVLGLANSAGSLASGGLVALGPVAGLDALLLPLLASLLLELVHLTAVALLMKEARPVHTVAARGAIRSTPALIGVAIRLVRGSTVLTALVAVEFLWGFGMVAFETFTPARLSEVLGDADRAAALLGPASAAAWLISSFGAAIAPTLAARLGPARAGAVLRVVQGLTVVGIGLATGPVGLLAAYLVTMAVHAASNPVHQGILHRAVDGPSTRATVISANSLTAQTGGALGGIALGALADAASLTTAILAGAAVLAIAAPLYLIAGRAIRLSQKQPDLLISARPNEHGR